MKTYYHLIHSIDYVIHHTNAFQLIVTHIHVGSRAYMLLQQSPDFYQGITQQATLYGIPVFLYDTLPDPDHVSYTLSPL